MGIYCAWFGAGRTAWGGPDLRGPVRTAVYRQIGKSRLRSGPARSWQDLLSENTFREKLGTGAGQGGDEGVPRLPLRLEPRRKPSRIAFFGLEFQKFSYSK